MANHTINAIFKESSGEKPSWTPITGAEKNMVVYGNVKIDGTNAADGDFIGAFGPGGESDCRAVADVADQGGVLNYYLTVVGNTDGDTITFKIWQSSSAQVYAITETVTFAGDTTEENKELNATAGGDVTQYTITASAGENGSISPSGTVVVNEGTDQEFTITADVNYEVDQLLVDGTDKKDEMVGDKYTFTNVMASYTINATFKAVAATQYTITASDGENGSINPSGSVVVDEGTDQEFTITADANYEVDQLLVDGTDKKAEMMGDKYTFTNVMANHTINATFKAVAATQYTITASAGENGSISPSGSVVVDEGTDQEFTITADSGYEVYQLFVDGVDKKVEMVGDKYTFTNVMASHTINATFDAVAAPKYHSADYNPEDYMINVHEVLRVIQIYNYASGAYHCDMAGEDGYGLGVDGDKTCTPHSSDYNPQDWTINMDEVMRLIQFYNCEGYKVDPNGEDDFSPVGCPK
jgi:hypothetical protein